MNESDVERRWWKEAVVYQVYPRSFNDTDGDGIGDLPGVLAKVDYLDDLGVDVVWLNPVYQSPNADMGYDISDYRAIMDEFGTMADWEALLEELHDRDMKLIMDLVVNHTSDEHEWFVRSRERDPEYDDFYWWREGVDAETVDWPAEGGPAGEAPPTGWESMFGGSTWEYDEGREEWYLHLFDVKQPDLYWPNPDVREAVYDMMEWWLEKGIDGFRLDAIAHLGKADGLPTDTDWPQNGTMKYAGNDEKVHDYLTEMNERVLDRDMLTVGEVGVPWNEDEDVEAYLDPERDGLSMLVHFEHMYMDRDGKRWGEDIAYRALESVFDRWQVDLAEYGWNSLYLSNHDQPRQVSRFGSEAYRRKSGKLLATLLHTLRGTPFVYQGEELGMTNYPWSSLDEFQDVATINLVETAIERGEIDSFEEVRDVAAATSRDNGRTPMQWTDGEHAGFTTGEPWLAVNPDKDDGVNVADARADPDSLWHYYRALIDLRKSDAYGDLVVYGDYEPLTPNHDHLWTYTRTFEDESLLVTLNFGDEPVAFSVPETGAFAADATADLLLANDEDLADERDLGTLELGPWEARVYHVAA